MTVPIDLPSAIMAIGALGTASAGLIDSTKIGTDGGLSNAGFNYIESMVKKFLPHASRHAAMATPGILDVLHSDWINGVKLADQKAIAKTNLKLYLDETSAANYANATGLPVEDFKKLVPLLNGKERLPDDMANLYGKFDLMLVFIIDEAYQRADQTYRNKAKFAASILAVVLAVVGWWSIDTDKFWFQPDMVKAVIAGLLAGPLAPVSKDLASALQEAVKVAQTFKK